MLWDITGILLLQRVKKWVTPSSFYLSTKKAHNVSSSGYLSTHLNTLRCDVFGCLDFKMSWFQDFLWVKCVLCIVRLLFCVVQGASILLMVSLYRKKKKPYFFFFILSSRSWYIKTRLTESVKMRQYLSPVLLRCWAVVFFLLSCQAAGLQGCWAAAAALFFFGEVLTC